jgi:uridylate kinase
MLKLSWEAMSDEQGNVYDYEKLDIILAQMAILAQKHALAVVIWWGNIWRYRDNKQTGIGRVTSDYIGMTATIINAIVLSEKLSQRGHKVVVYSPQNMQIPHCTLPYNVHQAREDLRSGCIVFCAGGTGNPYATTDAAAVCKALELHCDVMIKATKVDGVYSADPFQDPQATKFSHLSRVQALQDRVAVMDHPALALAHDEKLPIWVCRLDNLDQLGKGDIGTWICE